MTDTLSALALEDGASVALGDGPHIRTLEAWAHWLCEHLDGASVRDGALRARRFEVAERGAQVLQAVQAAMDSGQDGFALLGHAVAAGAPQWEDLDGWLAGLKVDGDASAASASETSAEVPSPEAVRTDDPVVHSPDIAADRSGAEPPTDERSADEAAEPTDGEERMAPIAPPFGYAPELPAADETGSFDVMLIDVGDDPDRTASILRAGAGDVWSAAEALAPGVLIAEDVPATTVRRLHTLLATPASARIAVRDR